MLESRKEKIRNIEITPEKQICTTENKQTKDDTINTVEEVDTCSNSKHSLVLPGFVIPSPFKNSLFWPEPTKKVKVRNSRVKVPSVGTSDA